MDRDMVIAMFGDAILAEDNSEDLMKVGLDCAKKYGINDVALQWRWVAEQLADHVLENGIEIRTLKR